MSIADESFKRLFGDMFTPRASERPPIERYVRITAEASGFTVEPAVEWREGDDFSKLADHLDAMGNAQSIGKAIAGTWPDRAYFVEVWQEGRRGFAQIFQPFGLPRNR